MRCLLFLCLAVSAIACSEAPRDERPSFLLIVLDTVRADAVSLGEGEPRTTPHVAALAADGIAYRVAFAPAPWTVPSHASLLTGLRVDQHRVGGRRVTLEDSVVTLAERLREAGYETAGFSENPLVSEPFGTTRGFEHFETRTMDQLAAELKDPARVSFDLVGKVERWSRERQSGRPFFLFVNVLDAHEPYTVRPNNPFLPAGAGPREAGRVVQSTSRLCDAIPPERELSILRGLYLGDVRAADAKVGGILAALSSSGSRDDLVTIVTSDHGEHLGEHRLLDHQFSLRNVLLHVPLVVHGVSGAKPTLIDEPVSLIDVAPSVLTWAGLDPSDLPGRVLPAEAPATPLPPRDLFAAYSDGKPGDWPGEIRILAADSRQKRAQCGPSDRVFGDIASLTRYPHKLIWYRDHPAQLYDLRWDATERTDQAVTLPETAAHLETELAEHLERTGFFRDSAREAPALTPEAREALEGLGYVE